MNTEMDSKETQGAMEQETAPIQEDLKEREETLPLEEEAEPVDVDKLMADLEEARRLSDEYLNLAQRVQADFENYRRRNNAARAEAFDEGALAFAKLLLPVLDNFERAMEASDSAPEATLREGVQMVYRQLADALAKRGIEAISRQGEKFDPALEHAVLTAPREEGEPGTVCQVLQKGYKMDKYVLRHAMVKVVAD